MRHRGLMSIISDLGKRKLLVLTFLSLSLYHVQGRYTDPLPLHLLPDCNEVHVPVLREEYGVVNFSSSTSNRTSDCQQWDIVGPPGSNITLSIKSLDRGLSGSEACSAGSFLLIGPNPLQMICSVRKDPSFGVYRSHTNIVGIKFFIKGAISSFELEYIINGTECRGIRCQDWTCILPSWRCNGQFECPDRSDELACDTEFPPSASRSTVLSKDKVVTPGSRSDSAAVASASSGSAPVCGYGEIWCYVVRFNKEMCLHNIYKCNKEIDCLYGEDERHSLCGEQSCNLHLDEDFGWFTTPNYPHLYPSNSYCSWVIHKRGSSPSSTIQLRIIEFLLEDMPATDFVKIYDGPDYTYPQLKTLYGTQQSLVFESSSNWMNVIFSSNDFDEFRGFNITYQLKGVCLPGQKRCHGEVDCFYVAAKCDGVWDCVHTGYDETGCDHCSSGDYSCGLDTDQCYHPSDRCNGIARCANKADESNCSSNMCGSLNGTFLCDNKRCIYEKWTCDQRDDCGDHSDERFCTGNTRRVIIAAIGGSMICVLLLVILLGCSCKLYSLRHVDRSRSVRHETPMSRLYAELLRRRAPPPYHEAMLTSRNFDEVQQEYLQRMQSRQRSGSRRSRRSRRTGGRSQGSGGSIEPGNSGDGGSIGVEAGVGGDIGGEAGQSGAALAMLPTVREENENLSNELIDQQSSRDPLLSNDSETDTTDLESEGETANQRNQAHSRDGECNGVINDDYDDDDDEDDDDEDDDDENILESQTLSAQWARAPAARDDSSDDICILENDLDEGSRRSIAMEMTCDLPRNHCDSESIETASASLDSVDMLDMQSTSQDGRGKSFNGESESDSSSEEEREENIIDNSRNSTPKPEDAHTNDMICDNGHIGERRLSDGSLQSADSETISYDDVPLLPLHSTT